MAMKLEYVKVANYKKDLGCPHNNALVCDVKKCKSCGWNPIVAERRMNKIQGRKSEG